MNKLTLSIAMLAMAGVASAALLVPNGDFESGSAGWTEVFGGTTTYTYETTGGSGDNGAYATIDSAAGGWAILVGPGDNGAGGDGYLIGDIGVTAGATHTFTIDLISLAGGSGTGGLKVEAWAGNAHIANSGDQWRASGSTEWETFTFDWAVPAGTEKMLFVPLAAHGAGKIGLDNIGVVPEPATLGLLGLAGGAMVFLRRFRFF